MQVCKEILGGIATGISFTLRVTVCQTARATVTADTLKSETDLLTCQAETVAIGTMPLPHSKEGKSLNLVQLSVIHHIEGNTMGMLQSLKKSTMTVH
jgi:hypothetical protein